MKRVLIGAFSVWAGLALAQGHQQENNQQELIGTLEALRSGDAEDSSGAGNVSPSFDVVESAESFFFNTRVLSDSVKLQDFQMSAKNAVFDLVCVSVFERFASFETSPEEEREERAREFVAYWSFLEGNARSQDVTAMDIHNRVLDACGSHGNLSIGQLFDLIVE